MAGECLSRPALKQKNMKKIIALLSFAALAAGSASQALADGITGDTNNPQIR